MNLILTDKCTNSCPYCFAAQEMSRAHKRNDMSLEDFDKLMSFISSAGEVIEINVMGGEPLIYPDLDYVMHALFVSEFVSEIYVLTGGIVTKQSIEGLLPYRSKMRIMFNLNERDGYRVTSHHEQVESNIDYAVSLGFRICLGFNIYHYGFNGKEVIESCKRHGISHLRFSVACPIYGRPEQQMVVHSRDYNGLSSQVFCFLKECWDAGIEAHLDCPLPYCFFSDSQLGLLAKMHPGVVLRLGKCTPPVDINYDLSLMRCFSIGERGEKKSLTDFSSFVAVRQYFTQEIDSRLDYPSVFKECSFCQFRNKCNGGCLSNNSGFLSRPTKIERIERVLAYNDDGRVAEAIQLLKGERFAEDIDHFILAQLYDCAGDFDNALYYCQLALHESRSDEMTEKAVAYLQTLKNDFQA